MLLFWGEGGCDLVFVKGVYICMSNSMGNAGIRD